MTQSQFPQSHPASMRASAKRRVLVAEDDRFLADDFCRSLEADGFEVIGPVGLLEDALALVSTSESLHAAVLGVRLGDELVFPVADLLRARSAPFAFLTAEEPVGIPDAHRSAPCWPKPIDGHDLASRLRALIVG